MSDGSVNTERAVSPAEKHPASTVEVDDDKRGITSADSSDASNANNDMKLAHDDGAVKSPHDEAEEKQMRDIGAELYLEVQQFSREELEAERDLVRKKLDWVILPVVRGNLFLLLLLIYQY